MASTALNASCVIAGGGPAGMMLGYLLARAGVEVAVLEKHADFLRDFRGDTIHPSTLEVMHELGLLEEFLKLPHQEVRELTAQFGAFDVALADFSRLPTRCKFIAMMPQWDFLNFIAREAARHPSFRLLMEAEAIDLIENGGRIAGLRARTKEGLLEARADLVVAADGRHSVLRERAGLKIKDYGAPMDVLWFRLSRSPGESAQTMGRFDRGRVFITINRGEYWQCGYVIAKGRNEQIRREGLDAFRERVAQAAPHVKAHVGEIVDWDQIKLLSVQVDRLVEWSRPGLLCIGDAAHAMSPVGGVGINLAIQDAVAAANLLAAPLKENRLTPDDLRRVQRRREWPTRVTQRLQLAVQQTIVARALDETEAFRPPLVLRWMTKIPALRRIPARLVGVGVRPEHVSASLR
ncbi:MAG TPA: FAD-dependent oxidoreductase [Verrucomicrobiae bacterium]|nr:FAD-dependent oxidoreductase [Verrucomicrobiae bacterium]